MGLGRIFWSSLVVTCILATTPAWAENLIDAYQQAYHSDPVLAQSRAELAAQMQDKPLARSALLPHVGVVQRWASIPPTLPALAISILIAPICPTATASISLNPYSTARPGRR